MYLGVSHALHPKRAEFQGSPILGFSCLHRLMQNDQIRHVTAWGVFQEVSHAIVFAQMRRAVCQRQLSFLYVFTARRYAYSAVY